MYEQFALKLLNLITVEINHYIKTVWFFFSCLSYFIMIVENLNRCWLDVISIWIPKEISFMYIIIIKFYEFDYNFFQNIIIVHWYLIDSTDCVE